MKRDKEGAGKKYGCVIYAWGTLVVPVWLPADTLT